MPKGTSLRQTIGVLLGIATIIVASFVIIALAGLAVSPFTWTSSILFSFDAEPSQVEAKGGGGGGVPPPLGTLAIPLPGNLDDFVKDRTAAAMLGKALFWDMQVGGDGQTACATCHFAAGVDRRTINTIHPGADGVMNGLTDELEAEDFPFFGNKWADNIVGSQGVVHRDFLSLSGSAADNCGPDLSTARRVTGRNTPNMIMAIFNSNNFWDGRANEEFNGVDPSGPGNPDARIWVRDDAGMLAQTKVSLKPASQASQEVGPPNNQVEMSCEGRTFPELGRKLLNLTPLGKQKVATDDSKLGSLSQFPQKGLDTTYGEMIEAAFHDHLTSDGPVPNGSGFSQKEANFSLFWGLAVQQYGATLIPDDARVDRVAKGIESLTAQERRGLDLFMGDGDCSTCHGGSAFGNTVQGTSFANIGVRPVEEDGGVQPENKGKFKVPTLRNVELTGPYFHTGGYLTLRQVVNFYSRGGDNPNKETEIDALGLTPDQENDLVAFLLTLTDDRVRCERAPFDRPAIDVPNGPSLASVGAGGRSKGGCLRPFLRVDHFELNP